jgi:hypothetical protein
MKETRTLYRPIATTVFGFSVLEITRGHRNVLIEKGIAAL